jgi:superfamily II DNA or RNA helicase
VSEAQRIRWAHLFDPYIAVNTSLIEPLPHQITAVYGEMLPRQPLRFMLADDPGSGKTIMTGLYIKELIIRGDLERCLIVVPGNLVEQWQDELYEKFNLPFDIFTRDMAESARGNAFSENDLLVARMDQLARGEDLRDMLDDTDWDLVVVDEAHKLSATYFGNEVEYTKRYRLGEQLSELTRHFLLLTATPHNGKEREFQEFMALLDADRFEGMYRPEVHSTDVSDLMRRMVKEDLTRFDGRPLFPERRAYTVTYELSDDEAALYHEVTNYVREEFNRAEQYLEGGRRGSVGFALTILQRRLASSPEAIYQSLRRRRERLERRLREAKLEHRAIQLDAPELSNEDLEHLEDAPAEEVEALEEELVDEATAARTVEGLELEIQTLEHLEQLADTVRRSGEDRKWEELSCLLQDQEEMFDAEGRRRKLVIFTEHKDTLFYLADRIRTLIGRSEAVVTIHGGMRREQRRQIQEAFTQDKETRILVATDAAGEGINLQRAHLMINYDLPWNPNRIEQRFGRIHRIGQTEVCHLWNLVAEETREGDVYQTLLGKLEQERKTLGGAVFDVLGKAIEGRELRQLMLEAIRYGDKPEVKERLTQKVEGALDRDRLETLMEEEALAHDVMGTEQLLDIKEDMQRAQARRLQPHYIASFFREAFERLGGTMYERETGRYEITYVPARIRNRARRVNAEGHVLRKYERICFEKDKIRAEGKPSADLVAPGHPLLDAVIDLVLEKHRSVMKEGAVLVDEADPSEEPRALVYLEHTIEDGREKSHGTSRVSSRRFQFAEIEVDDAPDAPTVQNAGPAPYLNYRSPTDEEQELLSTVVEDARNEVDLEDEAVSFAIQQIVPDHLNDVRKVREPRVRKAKAAVKERLTKEIQYWDHRAEELRLEEEAGKKNAKLNAAKARQRADDLEARLEARMDVLEKEQQLSARPPSVIGGALIIPQGLLKRLRGERSSTPSTFARETTRVERVAVERVMAAERALHCTPRDVGDQKLGYDVESNPADDDEDLRFLEVKGRIAGADTVTITRNEILTALNRPDNWILALVEVPREEEMPDTDAFVVGEPDSGYETSRRIKLRYVHEPPFREPGFAETSVNFKWDELWTLGRPPDVNGAS